MGKSSVTTTAARQTDVVCPFCALLCDDLTVTTSAEAIVSVEKNGCARAKREYARPSIDPRLRLQGAPANYADAVAAASKLLKRSHAPFIGGLGTDIDGARAALDLASKIGASVDHMQSTALDCNIEVLQSRGWITTTLSELRNHADLLVLVGIDVNDRYAEFLRRVAAPKRTLTAARGKQRKVYYLGPQQRLPRTSHGLQITHIKSSVAGLTDLVGKLRARYAQAPAESADSFIAALRAAAYPVFVWAAGQYPPNTATVLVRSICEWIDELNESKRAAGLALGGDDGGLSALQTCAWLSGFPLHISYAGNTLHYEPSVYSSHRILTAGTADVVVWIDSFSERPPPVLDNAQLIVVGTKDPTTTKADIVLPVGVPGVDHGGRMIRTDSVVSLPLRRLRNTKHRSAAQVLRDISAAL